MGKTFRRDQAFRPKKQGCIFTKDQNWKKQKHSKTWDKSFLEEPVSEEPIPEDTTRENTDI